ncbi:hypothetical protein PITC_037810 [Penicillium italicum]|uniref:Uncharacterized protein n=1 Tax=Penicillium italicum TaxID=40296 RepID=A0A0A2LE35_PENIT|nr:hypothetical protein PITC_037810 [Penicillium italicum]
MMSTPKRAAEGLEHSKAKRVCRPAPLDLKSSSDLPIHLANGDNLSPFVVQNGQRSPIPGKLFSQVLNINESSKTTLTKLANGDDLSPRLVQQIGQPSPIPHALINKSLSINETSEATPPQGQFLFSGNQGITQPTVDFNPRLSTPNNGASNTVNVNWPLPYTRSVGPVNEDGFAVVTQTCPLDRLARSVSTPDPSPHLESAHEFSTSAGPMENLARSLALLWDSVVVALSVITGSLAI